MLKIMGQFGMHYKGKKHSRDLMATPSLLSRVIEFQGHDMKILSIRDRVRLDTSDEGWAIHMDGSLRYKGRVVVP